MKIQPNFDPLRFFNSIRSGRNNGEGGAGRNQYDPNQTQKDDRQKDSEQNSNEGQKNDPKALSQALDGFKADPQNQASGLTATLEESGSGLKVVVRDCNGILLRQFSAEEFLRLRATAATDSHHRGKILDQKL